MSSATTQSTCGPVIVSSTYPQTPPFVAINPTLQNISEMEQILHQTLAQCNKLAKSDTVLTHEVAVAKMLNYCMRMLHADGWHPPTIVRAMVLREAGLDKGMRSTMYQALRERRQEIETYRMQRAMVPDGERGSYQHIVTPCPNRSQGQKRDGSEEREMGKKGKGRHDGLGGIEVGAEKSGGRDITREFVSLL